MQQSKAGKEEEKIMEIRSKADAVDLWMSNNTLPECIRRRIKHYLERKWHEIRTVDSENLIPTLPMDLQNDIKRHICSDLVKRVPVLALMDDQLLDAMCGRLKPVVYSKESYVIRKGDPVKEMCFIFHGEVLSGLGRTEFRPVKLKTGDFCGEELLTWVFKGRPLTNLPISSQSALALTEVQAFGLTAEDLKFFISQSRLQHDVKLRLILRSYTEQCWTWAASVIQMAWRRYAKRKLGESLREEEIRLQDALAETCGTSVSMVATKEERDNYSHASSEAAEHE